MAKSERSPDRTTEANGADEWVPLSSLTHWARNPRRNDEAVDGVARSIIAFGWGSPVLVRGEDRRIIAGHTRSKAAARLAALWRRQNQRERADWQGLGLAMRLVAELGAAYKAVGKRLRNYPAHPSFIRSHQRSPLWVQTREAGRGGAVPGKNSQRTTSKAQGALRTGAVFEYAGPSADIKAARLLLAAP